MAKWLQVFAVLVVICVSTLPAAANVTLPTVFGDHMVVQREIPIPIWGTAKPGEQVTVSLADETAKAVAGKDGRWNVRLKPRPAGGPLILTVTGMSKVVIKDVLVGDVWFCAGQSNMAMMVKQCKDAPTEIANSTNPMIRCYTTARAASPKPLTDTKGRWQVAGPDSTGGFSASAYFFARDIQQTLKIPIGIIVSAWGGSNMEAFARMEVLNAHPAEAKPYFRLWEQRKAAFPAELAAAKEAAAQAQAQGKPAPKLRTLETHQARPASIYNGMVAPFVPYAIKGFLWNGGAANRGRAAEYSVLMPAMIQDWRKQWGEGQLPFFLVQMANWSPDNPDTHFEALREAMLKTAQTPGVGMVVTIDIGEEHNIHPKNKQEVGRRLALQAKAKAYGFKIMADGPTYDSMAVEGDTIRLKFTSVGDGLAARGGGELRGFEIAGEDRKFWRGSAKIDGDTILVRSDVVPHPVAVRYAWEMFPDCNLINVHGLPASPFRTDTWPLQESNAGANAEGG